MHKQPQLILRGIRGVGGLGFFLDFLDLTIANNKIIAAPITACGIEKINLRSNFGKPARKIDTSCYKKNHENGH